MFSPTLKVLISVKGGLISNTAHASSSNEINIATTGRDSVHVMIIDIALANALIHRKSASFEHLVRNMSALKLLHTSSQLIHVMIHQLPVDTIYLLQEAQSLYTFVQNWVIAVATLEPQAFLGGKMDKVTKYMSNEPAN